MIERKDAMNREESRHVRMKLAQLAVVGLVLAAASLILASCDGQGYSPTQPLTTSPPPPPPPPGSASVRSSFAVFLGPDSGKKPEKVQVFVDGAKVYSGPMQEQGPWGYGPYPYDVADQIETPAIGHHTLTLELTRPAVSPETYALYAEVAISREDNGLVLYSAHWNAAVTLATGEAWTGTFEILEEW